MTEGDHRHTIDIDALAAEMLSEHLVSAIDSIELAEGAARTPFDLPRSSELPVRTKVAHHTPRAFSSGVIRIGRTSLLFWFFIVPPLLNPSFEYLNNIVYHFCTTVKHFDAIGAKF